MSKFWKLCVFDPREAGGGLGATYIDIVHLKLIEKLVVFVLIELFSLGVLAAALKRVERFSRGLVTFGQIFT